MGDQCLTREFRDRRSKEHTTILFHSNTLNVVMNKPGTGEKTDLEVHLPGESITHGLKEKQQPSTALIVLGHPT